VTAEGPEDFEGLLRDLGADEAEIAEAEEDGTLALLAVEQLLAPQGPAHTLDEVCKQTGLAPDQVELIWRTLGFPQPRPGEEAFTDGDIEVLAQVGAMMAAGVVGPEMVVQLSRVIGSSIARVASAHADLIAARAAERRRAAAGSGDVEEVDDALLVASITTVLPLIPKVLEATWRRHLHAAARRRISIVEAGDELIGVVGFADLVGFTALSQQLNEAELAGVVAQFEGLCFDVVTAGGGRVVKMIGDEVMFTVDSPVAAAEMALALAEGTRDADELSDVRVGMAYGTLLERESDLFGPVVNLASRITKIAFPGSIVVSRELYDRLADDQAYVLRSMRHRYLKHIGRVPLYVLRRAKGAESRFAGRRQALREAVRARVDPATRPGA
jgi:adenylate cyclase